MNVGLRLAVVIGFITICCGSLTIANRVPERNEVDQTVPSPYYIQDTIMYFPPGLECSVQRDASAMKAEKDVSAIRR